MPVLRTLQVEITDPEILAHRLPEIVSSQPMLEELVLVIKSSQRYQVRPQDVIVVHFDNLHSSSLKTIRLKNFTFSSGVGTGLMPELLPLTLLPSLNAMHVHQSSPRYRSLPAHFRSATWLRIADGSFDVAVATVDCVPITNAPIASSSPILSVVSTLHLNAGTTRPPSSPSSRMLRASHVAHSRGPDPRDPPPHPTSVVSLKLTFEPYAARETRNVWDARLVEFLGNGNRENLKSLEVRIVSSPERRSLPPKVPTDFLEHPFFNPLKNTKMTCEKQGISFE